MNVIGILSELFWKLIKYVNNIINPFNGNLSYKKYGNIYINIYMILGFIYTWTSKIMDPSERCTPCIDLLTLHFQIEIFYYFLCLCIIIEILYSLKPGSSIFKYHLEYFNHSFYNICYNEYDKYLYKNNNNKKMINIFSKFKKFNKILLNHTLCMKINDKISEKKETISRSNKWKFIISEKSRKKIILGCKGETFFDKMNTFFDNWSNYYIIRRCCSYDILFEHHSRVLDNECKNKLKREDLPNEILKFLNTKKKDDINLETHLFDYNTEENNEIKIVLCDIEIDKLTELYSYYNYQRKIKYQYDIKKVLLYDLNIILHKNEKHELSNITQYYTYCNNEKIYKGWVSIIRIQNYSSQPVYYNNLIKRYANEIKVILNNWLIMEPNNNFYCTFDTKMNKLMYKLDLQYLPHQKFNKEKHYLNVFKFIVPFTIRKINKFDILLKNRKKIPWALRENLKELFKTNKTKSYPIPTPLPLPKNFK